MELIRLSTLEHNEARKIRSRQKKGTMREYVDNENYLCFLKEEYDAWKPKKTGRKSKERI